MGVFSSEAGNTDSLIRTKGRSNNSGLKKKKEKKEKGLGGGRCLESCKKMKKMKTWEGWWE